MFYLQHILGEQLAGVVAHTRDAGNLIGARLGEHLHEPMGFPVGDRAIEIVNARAIIRPVRSKKAQRRYLCVSSGRIGQRVSSGTQAPSGGHNPS